MGLILDGRAGIEATARRKVARGANSGPQDGVARPPGHVFGVDMPIIDPGNPGNSWLLYKCLLSDPAASTAPPATRPRCDGSAPTLTVVPSSLAQTQPWSSADRSALGVALLGHPMPYPGFTATGDLIEDRALTVAELERLRLWIAQGANTEDCAPCRP